MQLFINFYVKRQSAFTQPCCEMVSGMSNMPPKKNYQVRSGLARLCWWCEPQTHNWYSLCSLMDSICANSVNLVMGIILIYHYTYLIIKCAQFFKSQRFSYRKSVSTLPTLNFNTTCVFCGAATLMPITWTSHGCFKFLRI